jgi:hypothetical protein
MTAQGESSEALRLEHPSARTFCALWGPSICEGRAEYLRCTSRLCYKLGLCQQAYEEKLDAGDKA